MPLARTAASPASPFTGSGTSGRARGFCITARSEPTDL